MKALYNDGSVAELPQDEVTHVIRHSAAHIMAQAIKRLYPEADFAYGPATDNGFYYDVDLPEGVKISEDDFPAIEAEMKKIVKENLKFSVYEKPRAEAIALMEERGEKYKVEHIGDLDDDARITFYQQGDYIDMCVGPHVCYTKALKAFKLTGVSGAYWKGDKDNKMLTRINGVAFATKEELDEHMHMLEEAKKRDHRKIGREMDLFMMRDEAPGFPFFLPNGMILKNTLLDYWREIHHKAGYVEISTPLIMNKQLWKTSGHWDHYKDNMYSTVIDDEEYCIKPMNCPGGVLVYGIPEFRLPKAIVQKEIDGLKAMGVDIETNMVIGKVLTIDELMGEYGYEAVFVGSGAGLPRFMGIPGESLKGVYSANEFLTRSNLMKAYLPTSKTPIRTGKKVAVVGGGNVAMDAARSALRLGAESVYIVYRRGMAELPARKEEVEHAEEEGIIFKTLCNPVEIHANDEGFVKSITCIEMELGEPDASGRRRPIEKKGSEFELDVDTVIMSLGTSPNPLIRSTTPGLETNKHGCIVTDGDDGKTSRDGVYAGGDAVTGAATVIKAMGAGKAAAKAIDEYIQSK